MSRSRLPSRSNSRLSGPPPTDSAKPDEDAIDDVLTEVDNTGSLEKAARKLSKSHSMSSVRSSNSSSGPAAALGGGAPGSVLGGLGMTAVTVDDPSSLDDEIEEDESMEGDDEEGQGESEEDIGEIVHLQEVVEGLWIGDLVAAMDTAGLEERGIINILSLLRPKLEFPGQFAHYPLEIDDSESTDILSHLPSIVAWIQQALEARKSSNPTDITRPGIIDPKAQEVKKGGVLVHCQAGMSRSATAVAAYLMQTLELDPMEAVEMIKEKRPVIDPSATFWYQLGVFYNGDGKVSLKDRSTRQFYMERTATEVMNGNGGPPPLDKMAKYPATPTASNPPTPSGGHGRRKIRCKMCRRHLAVREHMMDHILDQAPVSRPRTPSLYSLPSPRASFSAGFTNLNGNGNEPAQPDRRASVVSDVVNPLTGLPGSRPRSRHPSMTSLSAGTEKENPLSPLSPGTGNSKALAPGLTFTSSSPEAPLTGGRINSEPLPANPNATKPNGNATYPPATTSLKHIFDADQLASRLPPHLLALRSMSGPQSTSGLDSPIGSSPPSSPEKERETGRLPSLPVSGQVASVKAANRRLSMLALTPTEGSTTRDSSPVSPGGFGGGGTPILVNPKCSGYFVEPLTWMNPVLQSGQIAGKLVCPNEKCGAKLGSFDWAGVQCGCKEWVTPGFCIHRSKVDEVW